MAVVVFGTGYFARIDHFEYAGDEWFVMMQQCHICCVPLICGCGAGARLSKDGEKGYKLDGTGCVTSWFWSLPFCLCGHATHAGFPKASPERRDQLIAILNANGIRENPGIANARAFPQPSRPGQPKSQENLGAPPAGEASYRPPVLSSSTASKSHQPRGQSDTKFRPLINEDE